MVFNRTTGCCLPRENRVRVGGEELMQIIRTFLGFVGGALVAALGLQYYRTGTVNLPALVQSLNPIVVGAGIGLFIVLLVLGIRGQRK